MELILIILVVVIVAVVYALIIRPFLVDWYSRIQAEAWKDVLFKKNKKTN
jgi:cytochrome bd-type quinol oxidase subunit 2